MCVPSSTRANLLSRPPSSSNCGHDEQEVQIKNTKYSSSTRRVTLGLVFNP